MGRDRENKGSEGMGMTRDRKEWENIERNGKGWVSEGIGKYKKGMVMRWERDGKELER